MTTKLTSIITTAAASLFLLGWAPVALQAATFDVSTLNDDGFGTLREALTLAGDGDTITISATGTLTLTSGELLITTAVTIIGPGTDSLTIDGDNASRVFRNVAFGAIISSLTIANGNESAGGGIFNDEAALTVSNVVLSANSAESGGAIYNDGSDEGFATLTVLNSTLSGNSADEDGGGVYNNGSVDGFALLNVISSTLDDNSAELDGGAVFNNGVDFGDATVTIENSTLSGNSAEEDGGGVYNDGGSPGFASLLVINSTLSGNSAANSGGGIYNGVAGGAVLTILNSTLSGNSAESGGGILNDGDTTLGSTILNAGDSGANLESDGGSITSLGFNLSSDDGGGFLTEETDQVDTDPLLGPLDDNGGPTLTHALECGSTAIDTGENFAESDTDQRGEGFDRTVGAGTDIGAYEVQEAASCPAEEFVLCSGDDGSGVFANATSPNGAVVDYTSCSVSNVSTPPPGSLFPICDSTVTSTVVDVNGETNTCTFTVHVAGASEQLVGADFFGGLAADVQFIGIEPSTLAKKIAIKLQKSATKLNSERNTDACRRLQNVLSFVARLQKKGKLTTDQADFITTNVTRIRAVVPCS